MIALWMLYAIVVSVTLGLAAAVVERAGRGKLTQRRWIWMTALGLTVALPVWAAFGPDSRRAGVTETVPGGAALDGGRASGPSTGISGEVAELIARADTKLLARLDSPLTAAWLAAALLAMAAYGAATLVLARRRRSWRAVEVDGHAVLLSPAVGPAVVGALRPRIVVPEWSLALPSAQRALMLEHEREHVRARDPLMLHGAAMIALLMPWNAGAWWLNRRLRLAVELDCDARVLAAGRDPREYGTLLLDVCSRRTPGAPFLAPALLERTSSLTKRILAMHPERTRFPHARIALGAAAALAIVMLACEMPSPEMLAPDGKDAAATRVFGTASEAVAARGTAELRATVARHFPEVARGEGGPAILYVVTTPDARVVFTETQAATELARMPAPPNDVEVPRPPAQRPTGMKVRRPGPEALPSGIGALRPDDIEAIDVSKHAAGVLAPAAVSVIQITLKPGAKVPLRQ
jgi:beta-lactamase regulating signal transducer with metallopeptidase domain